MVHGDREEQAKVQGKRGPAQEAEWGAPVVSRGHRLGSLAALRRPNVKFILLSVSTLTSGTWVGKCHDHLYLEIQMHRQADGIDSYFSADAKPSYPARVYKSQQSQLN